jgi:hypothetical protein
VILEVGQLVLARPLLDFPVAPIRAAVAGRPATVVGLEPLLVLAAEVYFQHDALDLGALIPEPAFHGQIRAKEVGIVLQLAFTRHPGMEGLAVVIIARTGAVVVALTAVRLEQFPSTVGQHVRMVLWTDLNRVDEPLFSKVLQRVFVFAKVPQVAFADHPKRTDGGQHAAVLAIQLVHAFAVIDDDLAFTAAWQIHTVDERVSRVPLARLEIPFAILTIPWVFAPAAVDLVIIAAA